MKDIYCELCGGSLGRIVAIEDSYERALCVDCKRDSKKIVFEYRSARYCSI